MGDFFEAVLDDLVAALPSWWAHQDSRSELSKLLLVLAEPTDRLAGQMEQIHLDQALSTAGQDGLRREWAVLYGAANEQLPPTREALRGYMQARAAEDGSLPSMYQTLLALLANPANDSGTELTFLSSPNLVDESSFEGATYGVSTYGVSTYGGVTGWVGEQATVKPSALKARTGHQSLLVEATAAGTVRAVRQATVAVESDHPYAFSAYAQPGLDQLVRQARVRVTFADAGGAAIAGVSEGALVTEVSGGWVRPTLVTTPPEGAKAATIAVEWLDTLAGEIHHVDDVMVTRSSVVVDYGQDVGGGLTFPADGSGLVLYEDVPPLSRLVFPTGSGGLQFPADGGPLVFPQQGRVEILERPADPKVEVRVREILIFDRGAFARAVDRFRMASDLPSVIVEVP